jgi:signal transduction histidine kinase/ActR/RegA family two-component response regulator
MTRPRFRDLPIRRKLVIMTLASTAVALLIASGGFLVWDVLTFRAEIQRDINSQVRIIAENAAPALVFNDEQAAGETLAALKLRPRVLMGCLYNQDARLFATYHRSEGALCPAARPPEEVTFTWEEARVSVPVVHVRSRVGSLFIQREFRDVFERLLVGALTVAALLVLCILVAVLIGSRLQRSIADPLLDLAGVARQISDTRDYGLRAVPRSHDEVGVVVHAFNDMLDRIGERTTELSRTNADLEREVEERKRMEVERTVLLARERDANRLKDEFLATLSHELRTPLNAVLGWTRVLRATSVSPATQARALESIERNARAQARLIEDLLEVSRIVTGKLRLQVRPTDLAAIVDSAVEVVQPAAAAKRITLVSEVAVRPAMTSGDPDRLQQVVWNLLSNAVKFTPAGGEIVVGLRREQGFVLTVTDNGIGLDPSFVPHVFEPFRQADGSASREHGGLGLGLAIVRQITELHGGTVAARSAGHHQGATFEVRLPSELAADPALPRVGPGTRVTVPSPEINSRLLTGVHVLVVDDEEDARELLQTTFEAYGATVSAAGSATEALDVFDRTAPDVVISDIGMPFEDGYTLIKRVRARGADRGGLTPAVALTAYAAPADRLAALAAGYQAHMAKPYEPSEIAALVERLARDHRRGAGVPPALR